jgi:transposase InsO family protein
LKNVGTFKYVSLRLNIPSESLSLAQEGIFLALENGISVFYTEIYEMGLLVAIESEPLQSFRYSIGAVFDTLLETKVLVERWRDEYNHIRPYSALGYRPPAPEVVTPRGA